MLSARAQVVLLGTRLQAAAERLALRLQLGGGQAGRTLVHGDYKTANLFISGAAACERASSVSPEMPVTIHLQQCTDAMAEF